MKISSPVVMAELVLTTTPLIFHCEGRNVVGEIYARIYWHFQHLPILDKVCRRYAYTAKIDVLARSQSRSRTTYGKYVKKTKGSVCIRW